MVLAAQVFSAFAWSGHEVAGFTLLLDSTTVRTRPHAFALQTLVQGTSQLLGGSFGAFVLSAVDGDFQKFFAWSTLIRLVPPMLATVWLPASPRRRRRSLSLRVVGWRPHGGVVHRPLLSQPENFNTSDNSQEDSSGSEQR
jgi:hypothetical protein